MFSNMCFGPDGTQLCFGRKGAKVVVGFAVQFQ